MRYIVTAEEMKEYDRNTMEHIGIPGMVLMERAAWSVKEEIEALVKERHWENVSILILAGCGNNGGDGLALARLLWEAGFQVEVALCGDTEHATRQWKEQYRILQNYPVKAGSRQPEKEYTILVDALFGVGLSREVAGEYAQWIGWFNRSPGYKIALDVPSGIHSDNGHVMGCGVKADKTVTFGFPKRGLYLFPGCLYAGQVMVREIGITCLSFGNSIPEMFCYTESPESLLPKRKKEGNKGNFGKLLLVAGSRNMAGAAVLAARSAYRTGAGMVKVITPEANRVIVQSRIPEALLGQEEDLKSSLVWADVAAIGPGLGRSEQAKALLETLLQDSRIPLVIDADGLNLLAENENLVQMLKKQGAEGRSIILTPHMGELSRLTGKTMEQLKENPVEAVKELAFSWQVTVVGKDARTLTAAPKGHLCLNLTGNSGMATAGSGDVLTGIIAGLLAQGMTAFDAASIGVYLHGAAGDEAAGVLGEHGVMAGDMAEYLPFLKEK